MTYLTPLELSLESELERIGIPFEERQEISSEIDAYLRLLSVPDKVVDESIKDPKLRQIFRRAQAGEALFATFLVDRCSEMSSKGVYVRYGVIPSKFNTEILRLLPKYKQLEPMLDHILNTRTFSSEIISVWDDTYMSPLHVPHIPGITPEAWDFRINPPLKEVPNSEKEIIEEMEKADLIDIAFYRENHPLCRNPEIEIRKDFPQNLFKGLSSPVTDAYEFARIIAEFIKKY